MKHSHCN